MSLQDLLPVLRETRMEPQRPREDRRTRWARKNQKRLVANKRAWRARLRAQGITPT